MATMHDVARMAGVSQSTVSHYLNQTRPVHPDTQRAIQEAIERTGYVHDALARSLRTGRSDTIGLAITAITNPYFGALVRGIEERVADAGRTVLLVDTGDDPDRERDAVEQLLRHRPEGVLLAPARSDSPGLDLLVRRGVPTVLVDRVLPEMPPKVDAIGVHNHEPMKRLVQHLAEVGHRSIALLASLPDIPTTVERVEGYHAAIAAIDGAAPANVRHASNDPDRTAAAIDELFAVPAPPTAIIGGNNQATIAAMRWLRERSLEIPADVSVASFDDFEWADLFHPRLTALRQPIEDLASRTASLLETRLADPDGPGRVVRLEPQLIVRDSVATVRA